MFAAFVIVVYESLSCPDYKLYSHCWKRFKYVKDAGKLGAKFFFCGTWRIVLRNSGQFNLFRKNKGLMNIQHNTHAQKVVDPSR